MDTEREMTERWR